MAKDQAISEIVREVLSSVRGFADDAKTIFVADRQGRVWKVTEGKALALPELPREFPEHSGIRWRARVASLLAGESKGELLVVAGNGGFQYRWNGQRWLKSGP